MVRNPNPNRYSRYKDNTDSRRKHPDSEKWRQATDRLDKSIWYAMQIFQIGHREEERTFAEIVYKMAASLVRRACFETMGMVLTVQWRSPDAKPCVVAVSPDDVSGLYIMDVLSWEYWSNLDPAVV